MKINENVVFPWFHSTIGHYREYADRLWYLPDGYRMGLGTLDLQPGKAISVTDFLRPFPGDLYSFFEEVFAKDQEVMAEIDSIPLASDVNTVSSSFTGRKTPSSHSVLL